MKTKLISLFAVLAILVTFAPVVPAQVGGNDWTAVSGGPWTITRDDGTKFSYSLNYSPASVTRDSDGWTGITIDMVYTDSTPTKFFHQRINCQTHQYTIAMFNISVTPAVLGTISEIRNIKPNTAGPAVEAIVCR
jgi:hypothetical protein